jgi:KUP system potassium uptake protein
MSTDEGQRPVKAFREPELSEPIPTAREEDDDEPSHGPHKGFWALVLGSLGVVFGDIGTSPLYALQECVHGDHAVPPTPENLFGILSLIFWAMTLVVTFKYVAVLLKADNRGEGGIMALLALVPDGLRRVVAGRIGLVSLLVIAGTALLFGDGIITPSISVLSAVEGLAVAEPGLSRFVVPVTCAILFALFAIQSRGTGSIGRLFGPVMLVWFTVLAGLGVRHILTAPEILGALSPHHAIGFFIHNGAHGFALLGSVVLCVTGGEALYADMGHFGPRPIRVAWLYATFPALVLCYFGQGAMLLANPEASNRVFFSMVPKGPVTFALVLLATAATVIASQALISAVFSLTHQAVRLGYLPRVEVLHTSRRIQGQIYIPVVNWSLAVSCLLLVSLFQQSSKLAAAYGLAVSGTMALTSIVFFYVTRSTWKWPAWKSVGLLCLFLSIDLPFLGATCLKFLHGGYIPVLVGLGFFVIMATWVKGRALLAEFYASRTIPIDEFLETLDSRIKARIPGLGVVMASPGTGTPPVLLHITRRFRVLHEQVFVLTVTSEDVPNVPFEERVEVESLGQGFYRVLVRCGFIDHPNVPRAVRQAQARLLLSEPASQVVYLVNHETFVATDRGKMGRYQELFFALLARNAVNASHYFGILPEQVVELGSRIDL